MPTKTLKIIHSGLLPSVFITLTFISSSCGPYNRNLIVNASCTGIVVKKYIDYGDHAAHTLWIQGKGGKNDICYITTFNTDSIYLYNKITVGDSIIKKPGSKVYHVKSTEKDFIYEYNFEQISFN